MVQSTSSARKWAVLVLLVLGAAMLNYSNMVFASRPLDVMELYGMTQAQLTAISGLGVLPGAFFSIVLGNFFDKHDNKTMCYVGSALILLAALCQLWRVYASSYMVIFIITFLSGTFYLPTQVLPAKLIEAWFSRKEMGVAMGIFGASAGLGIMGAFAMGIAISSTTAALFSCFIGYIVVTVLWFFFGRLPQELDEARMAAKARQAAEKAAANAPKVSVKDVFKSKTMWFVMICGGLAAGAPLIFNSYVVNAFIAKGMEPAATNMLGIVFNISLVCGAIVTGFIVARTGKYNGVYGLFAVAAGVCLFGCYLAPVGPLSFVLLALGGLFGASTLSVNMARIGLIPLTGEFGPECIGIAGGMNNTAMGVCMFFLPTIIAACLNDNYLGVFITVLVFFLLMALVGGVLCAELGEKGKLAQAHRAGTVPAEAE